MPNRINQAMVEEYRSRFGEAPDLVAVDLNQLTVEEAEEFRDAARAKDIQVFVVKTSLARRVIGEQLEEGGADGVIDGPTALVWGGEGMPDLARLVDEQGKKTGKLTVRGGVFEKKVLNQGEVVQFKNIPDRHTLLGQTLATIIAPLTGSLALVNSLLSAPAALTDALIKKNEADE